MSDDLLAQGTVDARNEERIAYNAGPQERVPQRWHDHLAPGETCTACGYVKPRPEGSA